MTTELPPTPSTAISLCEFFTEYARVNRFFSRQFDLTPQLARTLFYIHEERPCCVRKLTELLRIHPTSTSKLLSRLERRGLLIRTMDRVDHRLERIALTAEGINKVEALREKLDPLTSELDSKIATHMQNCQHPAPVSHLGHLITHLISSTRPTT
jgi:DNA-binding MarR family transcriptional regulator